MTTFPNAPMSHSALFDNVPAVEVAKDNAARRRDYTDGVTAIWANGRTQRGRCRSDKVMTADTARAALTQGAPCVFVMTGDVEAVQGHGADG